VSAPRMKMYVIPKTADRIHCKLKYTAQCQLSWTQGGDSFLGFFIQPMKLGYNSVLVGPFAEMAQGAVGLGVGRTLNWQTNTSVGDTTLFSRFLKYYVTGVDLTIKVQRQDGDDHSTVVLGMFPVTYWQCGGIPVGGGSGQFFVRNSAASPSSDNNIWPPGLGYTSTSNNYTDAGSAFTVCKQQGHNKYRSLTNTFGGKASATLRQSYSTKKFLNVGFPYDSNFSGTLPGAGASDGTPPTDNYASYHYWYLYNDEGLVSGDAPPGLGNEQFTITIDVISHVTCYQAALVVSGRPSEPSPPPEGKSEAKEDDAEIEEDLVDIPQLSLSSLSVSSPLSTPVKPLSTCLNPKHPQIPHSRAGTCL